MTHETDLFGRQGPPDAKPKRKLAAVFRLTRPEPAEAQVLKAVRMALNWSPIVRHVWRVNSGLAWFQGSSEGSRRPVAFHDIEGCADLIGILRDGRFLAVECKRPSQANAATPAQLAFLAKIRAAGGVAFVATSVDDVMRELRELA